MTSTNNSQQNNKAVFAPLAKYAVIGVIMVSIIITTAIMLNKQLGSVEQDIATIEKEISAIHTVETTQTTSVEDANPVATIVADNSNNENVQSPAATITAEANSAQITAITTKQTTAEIKTETKENAKVAIQSVETNKVVNSEQTENAQTASQNTAQSANDQIATLKLEQKARMAKAFERIKVLEEQQLASYKSRQNKQVEQLREQVNGQQKLIDALISRNNEWYELRVANTQRIQSRREDILNRI